MGQTRKLVRLTPNVRNGPTFAPFVVLHLWDVFGPNSAFAKSLQQSIFWPICCR